MGVRLIPKKFLVAILSIMLLLRSQPIVLPFSMPVHVQAVSEGTIVFDMTKILESIGFHVT
ncbi:MAG: hypothetical protein BAJATHORv1_30101 [Candidatus Thorarchaeota archaeon]|nr:MAG: hypothetical protein BAJATHORv1_30101 [Candidatus Thorarchaeota archaeon]